MLQTGTGLSGFAMITRRHKQRNPPIPTAQAPYCETVEASLPYAADRRHQQENGPPWFTDEGWVVSERRNLRDRRDQWH